MDAAALDLSNLSSLMSRFAEMSLMCGRNARVTMNRDWSKVPAGQTLGPVHQEKCHYFVFLNLSFCCLFVLLLLLSVLYASCLLKVNRPDF